MEFAHLFHGPSLYLETVSRVQKLPFITQRKPLPPRMRHGPHANTSEEIKQYLPM